MRKYQMIYLWSIPEGQVPNILSNKINLTRTQSNINSRLGRTIQIRPLRNKRFSTLQFNFTKKIPLPPFFFAA